MELVYSDTLIVDKTGQIVQCREGWKAEKIYFDAEKQRGEFALFSLGSSRGACVLSWINGRFDLSRTRIWFDYIKDTSFTLRTRAINKWFLSYYRNDEFIKLMEKFWGLPAKNIYIVGRKHTLKRR